MDEKWELYDLPTIETAQRSVNDLYKYLDSLGHNYQSSDLRSILNEIGFPFNLRDRLYRVFGDGNSYTTTDLQTLLLK